MPNSVTLLVRDLAEPVPEAHWPDGIRLGTFDRHHAREAHALLAAAYRANNRRGGGEQVADFAGWWRTLTRDAEYDPAAMFLAFDGDDRIVAFAHCWSGGHLKDIAVASDWQGRGLGTAMVYRAMQFFRLRGECELTLKVRRDNPAAERLYRSLGMVER